MQYTYIHTIIHLGLHVVERDIKPPGFFGEDVGLILDPQ